MNGSPAVPAGDDVVGAVGAVDAVDAVDAEARLQALLAAVQRDASAFDFHALLRRIDALRPQHPRTGEALRPRQEALRLGQAPELDFAPAALTALQPQRDAPPRLTVRFFGLLGPHGAMPLHVTEFVRERSRHHDDDTLAHFLDLFHHRMLSLFHRAWAQTQPVVQRDRPASDRFRVWLAALAGGVRGSAALPDDVLAFHAGWLAGRSAHPEMLCKVLGQVLGVPVRLVEHVGHWLEIAPADRSRLGHARNRPERSGLPAAQLGASRSAGATDAAAAQAAVAGARVWDRQTRCRLQVGPLTREAHDSLLPGGHAWQALTQLVRVFAGRDKRWDLQLLLRLGIDSWLGHADRPRTAARTLHLRPDTAFRMRPSRAPAAARTGAPDA